MILLYQQCFSTLRKFIITAIFFKSKVKIYSFLVHSSDDDEEETLDNTRNAFIYLIDAGTSMFDSSLDSSSFSAAIQCTEVKMINSLIKSPTDLVNLSIFDFK